MNRRLFITSTAAVTLAVSSAPRRSAAQGAGKLARIGWLTAQQAPSLAPYVEVFRAGLAELGYNEGRNLAIEFRYGNDKIERVPDLAAELVRLPVDLIVAQGAAVFEISRLGLPVPVVYVYSGDPISAGFAESLSRPRGNMTGLTFMAVELNGKRLELLREINPRLQRVALIANPEHPGEQLERAYCDTTARRLAISLDYYPTPTHDQLLRAYAAMTADPPQAISIFADGFAIQYRKSIIDFAMSRKIPVISGWPVFADSGALCTYGPRLSESYRRLASYVDRVLKGAKTTDLPIEQPSKFEMVVNLKTASALGIAIPQSVLLRADRVIE